MKGYLTHSIFTRLVVSLALSLCALSVSSAQEYTSTPVEVSREKVRINGQVCYSHIVLEKQTLYSISKAYNVSIEDIYKFNPSVKEKGLKKNSILIIPMAKTPSAVQEEKAPSNAKAEASAKPEQQKAPEKPVVAEPVKVVNEVTAEPAAKVRKAKRKIHTVKWFETIDDIAYRYGITANEIMRANKLTDKKLTKRQKLVIPNPGEFSSEELAEEIAVQPEEISVAVADTVITAEDNTEPKLFPDFYFPKKEITMSLLLPFKATGDTGSRQNMDFYSGVLLAVYDMSKEGISTNLNVYDVAEGNVIDAERIIDSDIVIGPVASGDIRRTISSVPEIKALVSPLDPRAESLAHTDTAVIHAPTPPTAQYNDLISWIREEMQPGDTLLFVTEKGTMPTAAVENMTNAIDSSGLKYNKLSYSILEGRDIPEILDSLMMSKLSTTRVYIASESEAFVNDVVRNLNVMVHQKFDVVLYAPSKIRSFETIEVENFHNTKMRVSTGYYIDYEDPKVKEFLLHYRALFNTEPTQFAYQGYDLAKYFIGLCSKYGNRWMEKLDKEQASMLQSNFNFAKTPYGGYVNNSVHRIVYGDNWKVLKVR